MRRCNLCGGSVEYIQNSVVYGKPYGSGWCYRCTECKAFVGTHINNPKKPLGILADDEMRELRQKCHELFDRRWTNPRERTKAYSELADKLGYGDGKCHFAWMSKNELKIALMILKGMTYDT